MQHVSSAHGCVTCGDLYRELEARYARGESVTVAELAAAIDRAVRTTRFHLSVLVRDGHIDVDRRKPLRQCGPRPRPLSKAPTPGQWVASLVIECGTCRRIMTVLAELAGRDWTARELGQAELAGHVGVTRKTLGVHLRRHLVEGERLEAERPLVRREAVPNPQVPDGQGGWRYVGSAADRYVLLSDLGPKPTDLGDLPGESWRDDAAVQLLDEVRWFTGPAVRPGDRGAAVARIAGHLADGYPYGVLLAMIHRRPIQGVVSDPYALLISLLPPPGSPYVRTAAEEYGDSPAPRHCCPECGVLYKDPATPPGVTCSRCTEKLAVPRF